MNDGSFELIQIKIPKGTILNPIWPAALSGRTPLLGRLFDVMGAIFGQRTPEFLSAAGYSDSPHFFFSGWNRLGEWFQVSSIPYPKIYRLKDRGQLYQIGFGVRHYVYFLTIVY